jgi:hypothetical protein
VGGTNGKDIVVPEPEPEQAPEPEVDIGLGRLPPGALAIPTSHPLPVYWETITERTDLIANDNWNHEEPWSLRPSLNEARLPTQQAVRQQREEKKHMLWDPRAAARNDEQYRYVLVLPELN